MKQTYDIQLIEKMAKRIRRDIVLMLKTNKGHLGGSTSITDIVASLYFGIMRFDPKDPQSLNSDSVDLPTQAAAKQPHSVSDLVL